MVGSKNHWEDGHHIQGFDGKRMKSVKQGTDGARSRLLSSFLMKVRLLVIPRHCLEWLFVVCALTWHMRGGSGHF